MIFYWSLLLGLAAREAIGFSHYSRPDLRRQGKSSCNHRTTNRVQLYYLPPKNYNDDTPPFSESESPQDRVRRMEMARELQKIYYKEPSSSLQQSSASLIQPQISTPKNITCGCTALRNLPTLTSNDGIESANELALLPGHQFIWNIYNPAHCHMFHSILSGPAPWYFVHVYLPNFSSASPDDDGEKPIGNFQSYKDIQCQLNSDRPLYGTLLRITDRRFQDEDGRIVLVVQAIDKVRVHNVASVPGISLTDVQLSPETELMQSYFEKALMTSASYLSSHSGDANSISLLSPSAVSGAARAAAAADTTRVRRFEFRPIFLEEKPTRPSNASSVHSSPNDSNATKKIKDAIRKQEREKEGGGPEYNSVVQLCNFDAFEAAALGDADSVTSQALKNYWEHLTKESSQGMFAEEDLFRGHGNGSSSQYSLLPEPAGALPKPSLSAEAVVLVEYDLWRTLDEMMRLISMASGRPVPIPSQLLGLLPKRDDWPQEFFLEDVAKSLATSGSTIGTASKSPFVRVDEITSANHSSYSPLRRAQRLSYAIWLLLDVLAMTGAEPAPPPRDVILSMDSIGERLFAAKLTIDGINVILKKMVSDNK